MSCSAPWRVRAITYSRRAFCRTSCPPTPPGRMWILPPRRAPAAWRTSALTSPALGCASRSSCCCGRICSARWRSPSVTSLRITRPDDWHLHLRDGAALAAVLPHSAARFARAIVMPNLAPPVTTTAQAHAYRARILAALPGGAHFEPLMTLYLTDRTAPEEIVSAKASGFIHGVKLYPAGATTHAEAGVTDLARLDGVLARMAEVGLVLQVHGEVTDPAVDVFDREARFIERVLAP